MGGKPKTYTPKDRRMSKNHKSLTRNRPKGAGAGRTIHRKGGKK